MTYVTSEAFKIGGITYSIGVYKNDAGYMAFCDCHKFTVHNMHSPTFADKRSAIRTCEELIQKHHAEKHPCRDEPDTLLAAPAVPRMGNA